MKKFFRKKLIRQNWCSFALYKTKKKYYSFITAYPIGPSQRGIRLISLSHNPVFSSGALPPGAPFLPGKSKKRQKQRQMTNLIVDNVILWFIMSEDEQSMIEVRKSSVFPIRAQEGRGRKGQPPKGIRCSCAGYAWDDGEYPAYCHSRCAAQEWGAVRPVFWLSHEQCLLCS